MDALAIVTLIIGVGIGSVSFSLNSLILAVNMRDYGAGIRLNPCDLIMTSIGLTNLLMQAVLTSGTFFNAFDSHMLYIRELRLLVLQCLIFLTCFNLWLTIWLSTYYCLKIVSFAHGILFILKTKISSLMPKLLFFSFVESLVITIPSSWTVIYDNSPELLQNVTCASQDFQCAIDVTFGYMMCILLLCIIFLIFTLIPIGMTLSSLWKHTRKMKKNEFSCAQMQAHVMAARTMLLLTFLFVAYYATSITMALHSFNVRATLEYFSFSFILFYPTLQSIVIITGNSKLRKAAKLILNQFGFCLNGDSDEG